MKTTAANFTQNFLLTPELIASLVEKTVLSLASDLRGDYRAALEDALERESSERGRAVLLQLLENAKIAASERVPLCQDTGYVWVLLEVGTGEGKEDRDMGTAAATSKPVAMAGTGEGKVDRDMGNCPIQVPADVFAGVNEAVARVYKQAGLRLSMVRDALCDRGNTGDNTPAFCELQMVSGRACRLHVMLKGGGSDNASVLQMLPPGAGIEGVREALLAAVASKGANACPPLLIGVGVGSTFDKVAGLAKRALLRPVGSANPNSQLDELERKWLDDINALGIGPGGFGGSATALALHINSAACHIAALPVAVNIGCSAQRSASIDLLSTTNIG
jgi:tartrate/fumarate subfamily iron-sulfur-dependent hydro-lyase alpha chain